MAQNLNSEIIKKTNQLLNDQYFKNYDTVMQQFAEDVVWIGPMDFQWAENLEAAKKLIPPEKNAVPPLITEEEYHLLTHSKDLWVVYGRFLLTLTSGDDNIYCTRIRATVVWRRVRGAFQCIHLHTSSCKDNPADTPLNTEFSGSLNDYIAQYLICIKPRKLSPQKLILKDCSGCYHYLYESEILAIEADKQYSHLMLPEKDIRVRKQISEFETELSSAFLRVHRSYLVNTSHIADIWLYHIRLSNGKELPVSREKYSFLKKLLERKKQ